MNPYAAAARGLGTIQPASGKLTPEEEQSLLKSLTNQTGQFIETLGLILDTPAAIGRGILAGDPISGFAFDRDRRVSGEELLDAYNLRPENQWVAPFAGFATEVATDPLAYISGPLTALGKGGQTAKAIGLLDNAPQVAAKTFADQTLTRRFTEGALRSARVPVNSTAARTVRPVYGPRYSQARLSLDDLLADIADPAARIKAQTAAKQYIAKQFGPTARYDDIAREKLGGTLGIGAPFGPSSAVVNPFGQQGAEAIADVLDVAGQGIAWSGPIRYGSSLFDKRVGGESSVAGQIQAIRQSQLVDEATKRGDALSTEFVLKLSKLQIPQQVRQATGVQSLFSVEANNALTRIIEGVPTAADTTLLTQTPGLRQWVDDWTRYKTQRQTRARAMGLPAKDLDDPFGIEYLTRYGDEMTRDSLDRSLPTGQTYKAKTSDMVARVDALKLPGGLDTIRRISTDSRVRAYARAGLEAQETDRDIASHIEALVQRLTGTAIPPEKADRIARIMRDINPDLPDDVPLFSSHPAQSITRYMNNSERSLATTEAAFEALADSVVDAEYTRIPGGKHYTLGEAMQRMASAVGLDTGPAGVSRAAEDQIRTRVASRLGIAPDQVNLSLMSVPESVVQRLTRINDFYSTPESQGAVRKLLDGLTTIFKSFVLAFPSRYSRDLYSGGFQNWLENGSWSDTLTGMYAASNVLAGKYDDAIKELRQIPRYQGLGNQQIIDMFLTDAGSSGTLRGLSTTDFGSANRTGEALQRLVPGLSPVTMTGSLSEFASKPGRSWTQFGRDFFTIKNAPWPIGTTYDTQNPLLRWGEKMNDVTDSINRLGGFIALLKQGITPEVAAKRVLASQVDYNSLTPFERNVMKFIFPWWSYNSRMGKFVVQHLMERPGGRYGQTVRGVNVATGTNDEAYVPTQLRQQFAVRDPLEGLFPPTGDTKRYIVGIDIPGLRILNTIRQSGAPGFMENLSASTGQTLGELMNQANPMFRGTFELATGQDLFSKRPLTESYTPADRIYQAVTGRSDKLTPLTKTVIGNIPGIQRALGIGGVLSDQRLSFPERLLKLGVNSTMGLRYASSDPEMELLDLIAKAAEQNSPWQRAFQVAYIPEELEQYVPLANQRLELLQKKARKDLQRRWKAEASGAPRTVTGTTNTPQPMYQTR